MSTEKPVTIADMLACARRELRMREMVYPSRPNIPPETKERELRRQRAIVDLLATLPDTLKSLRRPPGIEGPGTYQAGELHGWNAALTAVLKALPPLSNDEQAEIDWTSPDAFIADTGTRSIGELHEINEINAASIRESADRRRRRLQRNVR